MSVASGQSLQEYGIVIGLIAIVSVISLVMLGNEASSSLNNSTSQFIGNENTNGLNTLVDQLHGNKTATDSSSVNAGVSLTFRNGAPIQLQSSTINLSEQVSVTGSSGTTERLLADIQSLGQQLYDKGEISEAGLLKYYELANKGHQLAKVESLIELSAKKSGEDSDKFAAIKQTLNGKKYTPMELTSMLGGYIIPTETQDKIKPYQQELFKLSNRVAPDLLASLYPNQDYQHRYASAEVADFLSLYNEASQLTSKEPGAQQALANLVLQINTLADTTSAVSFDISRGVGHKPSQLLQTIASKLSHSDSAEICVKGQGKDTGEQCETPTKIQ